MVKHIVMFRLSGSAEDRRAAAEKFKEALLALPAQIDCLRSMEVGINSNPAEKWDVVLTATVPKHPAHVAAAALLADCKEERACVDYEC